MERGNKPNEKIHQVQKHAKQGAKYIKDAMEIEEKEEECILPDFIQARRLYGQGASELKTATGIKLTGEDEETERAQKLQQKMNSNIENAEKRIAVLTVTIEEEELKLKEEENERKKSALKEKDSKKVPSRPAKPTAAKPTAVKPTVVKPTAFKQSVKRPTATSSRVPASKINPGASSSKNPAATSGNKEEHKKKLSHLKNIERKYIDLILNEAVEDGCNISFDDIGGMELPKKLLTEMVILPSERPELFKGLCAPARGLLLFGPPGNGKTLLAKALASEAKSVFFNISASTLTSKWVGEGEKTVRALFAVARELQPAIIFIDEIDSLLTTRKENEQESSRRMKTEFLTAFDGLSAQQDERILVLGATNLPWELDGAALRRLTKRVYVALPDSETRIDILKKTMKKQKNVLTQSDFSKISSATEGYSGSDLSALASDASQKPIRELSIEKFRSIPADQLRGVELNDFYHSLQSITKSVSSANLSRFTEWNKEYGTAT